VGARGRHLHPLRAAVSEAAHFVSELRDAAPARMAGCARRNAGSHRRMNDEVIATGRTLTARLWSRNAAVLLGWNTVVSTGVFLLGLALLWLLVEYAHADKVAA